MNEANNAPIDNSQTANLDNLSAHDAEDQAVSDAVKMMMGDDAKAPQAPQEGSEAAPEATPPAEKTDPETARWRAQAKRERELDRRERAAKAAQEQAEARVKAAQEQASQLEALIKNINSREGIEELLKRANLDFNDFARSYIGLDPQQPDPHTEIQKLRDELKAEREKERAEKEAYQRQLAEYKQAELQRSNLNLVASTLKKAPDNYELVIANADNGAYEQVLHRAYKFIEDQGVTDPLSPDEQQTIIEHFANEVESELVEHAKSAYERISKLKKINISGISSHNNVNDTKSVAQKLQDVSSPKPATSFITNQTSSPKPLNGPSREAFKDEDEWLMSIANHFKSSL